METDEESYNDAMNWLGRQASKRTLLKAALFIVGGAIINVAVAWGCALFGERPFLGLIHISSEENLQWPTELPKSFPPVPLSMHCIERSGFRKTSWNTYRVPAESKQRTIEVVEKQIALYNADPPSAERDKQLQIRREMVRITLAATEGEIATYGLQQIRAGWPALSTNGFNWWESDTQNQYQTEGFHFAIVAGAGRDALALPFCPVWPGFAINTIFYAGMLWVLFNAPGFVRRRIRIMRHQCLACNYPVGTSPVCTECGVPLPSRSR